MRTIEELIELSKNDMTNEEKRIISKFGMHYMIKFKSEWNKTCKPFRETSERRKSNDRERSETRKI